MYLAVDLASKFSAAVLLDEEGDLVAEFDSWKYSQIEFSELCAREALRYDVSLAVFEDLPYGLSKQFQTKPATRLQGIVIKSFHDLSILDRLRFINPSDWQRGMGVFKSGKDAAREKAQTLGFEQRHPIEMYSEDIPPLGKEHAKARASVRANLKKASTDYDDAFLIGKWVIEKDKEGTLDSIKGFQKYEE